VSTEVRAEDEERLAALAPEQRAELERERALRVGDELVWIEPEGRVRREKLARLYYVRTARGMFRWSKIEDVLVEV
jgi:hypothetical protein